MVLHVLRDFYAVKICPRRGKCPLSGMHTYNDISYISYNDETWNSYASPKIDPKHI